MVDFRHAGKLHGVNRLSKQLNFGGGTHHYSGKVDYKKTTIKVFGGGLSYWEWRGGGLKPEKKKIIIRGGGFEGSDAGGP